MTARFTIPLGRGNRLLAEDPGGLLALLCIRLDRTAENCTVRIGSGARIARHSRFYLRGPGAWVDIGAGVTWSAQATIGPGNPPAETSGARLIVGEGVRTHGIRIVAREAPIAIGRGSMLSHDVEIRSSDAHKLIDIASDTRLNPDRPVEIGPQCWIGARAMILQGTVLPRATIVGAQSLVKHAFETENTVIAGSPARVIRQNTRWER